MALTESQILDALTVLGLPARTDLTYALAGESNKVPLLDSDICRKALSNLEVDQETKVIAILAQWTAIEFDTDRINSQGLDSDPYRTRNHLASLMARVIGYYPASQGVFRLARG